MGASRDINAVGVCTSLLHNLGWNWNHPRVADWLVRVGKRLTGQPYEMRSPIPERVYTTLAMFLDLRYKCQKLLTCLTWDWDHPKVRQIELKYRCIAQLPLAGYRELYAVLDDEWLDASGGF